VAIAAYVSSRVPPGAVPQGKRLARLDSAP
jgi:hypothetical protein